MTALTASRNAALFFFGSPCRRIATHYHRRGEEVSVLMQPSLVPLPLLRHSLGLRNGRKRRGRGKSGLVRAEEELGVNHGLEEEIYKFMQMSANPMDFPSKEDLITAGREDLVRAIAKEKGWLAYGWDSDEENEVSINGILNGACMMSCEVDSIIFQHKMVAAACSSDTSLEADSTNLLSSSEDVDAASLYRRPMDMDASDGVGIEGILSRLEKERSLVLGFAQRKEEMLEKEQKVSIPDRAHVLGDVDSWNTEGNPRPASLSFGEGSHHLFRSPNSHLGPLVDVNNYSESGTWRAWSIQRSGDPLTNFEAAEIVLDEEKLKGLDFGGHLLIEKGRENVSEVQFVTGAGSGNNCPYDNDQGGLKDEISVHLQRLELQLTSALKLFECITNGAYLYKAEDQESLLKELHKLSDTLEFQQNEIKKARDILRSTRAKLTVIEGKIALELIESQKNIEEKQMRLHAAESALSILRHVWIVWPKSASEVLLTGSFDGWTSQRRMEKKNPKAEVFSLCLKLYPGRYEIKFIVDGVWTVDHLRPVVNSNGFQNNLLVVT